MIAFLTDGAGDTPVIPSVSLTALLGRRDAAVAALQMIAQGVADYAAIGAAVWTGTNDGEGPWSGAPYTYREPIEQRPSGRGAYLNDEKWLAESTKALDAAIWDHLLHASGLRTFMDAQAREEWRKQIDERRTPPLTKENIAATFALMHSRRGEFFERGVLRVFRELSWDHKTNQPVAFGKRIILRAIVDGDGHPGSYSRADKIDDLDRALHLLDRKPEPDHRTSIKSRLWRREPRHAPVESPYLRVKTFRNGNGHVEFLRLELIDELNRILAKHFPDALPHHRAAGTSRGAAGLVHTDA